MTCPVAAPRLPLGCPPLGCPRSFDDDPKGMSRVVTEMKLSYKRPGVIFIFGPKYPNMKPNTFDSSLEN